MAASRTAARAKDAAVEDARSVAGYTRDLAASGAYVYPLLGALYVLRRPKQTLAGENLRAKLVSALITALVTLVLMFSFTYLPQVAVLAFVSGPLAFIAAALAVLAESYVIISWLTRALYLRDAATVVFDAVLVAKGHSSLVEQARVLERNRSGNVTKVGRAVLKPIASKFSVEGLVRYVLTLPLNAIPGVGTGVFLVYNGRHAGPSFFDRYMQLKRFDKAQRREFIDQHAPAMTAFGAMHLALGLIPFVGIVSQFTSAAGAALYVSQIEDKAAKGKTSEPPKSMTSATDAVDTLATEAQISESATQ